MVYIKNIYLLILCLFLFSCKGSNNYIITNSGCNCNNYLISKYNEFNISISGIYYLIEKDMISEITIEVFNNRKDTIFFNSLENNLDSQKYDFKNITKDTIIYIPPNRGDKIVLAFDGKFKNLQNSIPKSDEQTLFISGIKNFKNKFDIEKIYLSTTTWNY